MNSLSRAAPAAIFGAVRAEEPSIATVKAAIGDLQKAWTDFRAENDKAIAELKKGKADVVATEKIDRINDDVGKLQASFNDMTERLAASRLGGASAPGAGADPVYAQTFAKWFRGGRNDADVEAAQHQGPRAAMSVGSNPDGGFLAPIEWDRTITDKLKIISPMRAIARVQTISGTSYTKLFNDRATASGWVGEATARPVTNQSQLASLQFDTGEIFANPSATQRVLDDALVNIEQWLSDEVDTEFAFQEGVAFVSGDGTNSRPFGFLTYVTGAANAARHPWGAIALVNSGAAAAVTADGLVDLVHALPSERAAAARFVMNRLSHGAVRKLKDTTNQYLWSPSLGAGQPPTLLGYPLTEMAAMPNIAAGAKPIAFGDFQRGYLVIDRAGVRVLRDPYTSKPNILFYTTKRVGGGVYDPEALKVLNISA